MSRLTIQRCAIALLSSTAPLIASAAMTRIANNGAWSAYAGQAEDGQKLCTVSAQGGGRWMGMKYFAGDTKLVVHLMNDRWDARAGLSVSVTAEFDSRGAWRATAQSFRASDGQTGLQFTIPKDQLERWLTEFKTADKLTIRFPNNDSVADWSVSLDGSDRIVVPFAVCMAATFI